MYSPWLRRLAAHRHRDQLHRTYGGQGCNTQQKLRQIGLVVDDIDALIVRLPAASIEPRDVSALGGHAHRLFTLNSPFGSMASFSIQPSTACLACPPDASG